VIGVALDDWDDEALRKHAHEAIAATLKDVDEEIFERLASDSPTSRATTRSPRPSRR